MMDKHDMVGALEAMLFAAGDPLTLTDIKKVFERLWGDAPEEHRKAMLADLKGAIEDLKARWQESSDNEIRGFKLTEVAEGLAFRSNPRFAGALRAMREQRPVRLSRAALETLAIVAYRQPVTKPEIDHIRGVDCSATIHLLLDRSLLKIVGKREEPGLPLLYGTSKEFLSFFNISNLAQLPSLREYHELTDDSQEQLDAFDSEMGLEDLRAAAQRLRGDHEPAVEELDEAVGGLKTAERVTRSALAEHGIKLEEPKEDEEAPATPGESDAQATSASQTAPLANPDPDGPTEGVTPSETA